MKKIINWGLIGLGNAANNLATQFVKLENANLLAVASLSEKKRDYYKENYKLDDKNVYSNYESIFQNKDIDIIYIALPNSFHEKYCLEAINYNKNVLVEKPLTFSIKSFKKIKDKFIKNKILLEEGTANKFHPFYQKIFENLKKLDFNKLKYINTSFGNDALGGKKIFNFRFKRINHKKRLFNKDLLGGAILDGGIYPISLLIDIMQFFNHDVSEIKYIDCVKKSSKNVDLESTLNLSINDTQIKIKTSLINNLENNFILKADDYEIILENIFDINSKSMIKIKSYSNYKEICNSYRENSYFFQIKNISELLLKKDINEDLFKKNFSKIEKNNNILSNWLNY